MRFLMQRILSKSNGRNGKWDSDNETNSTLYYLKFVSEQQTGSERVQDILPCLRERKLSWNLTTSQFAYYCHQNGSLDLITWLENSNCNWREFPSNLAEVSIHHNLQRCFWPWKSLNLASVSILRFSLLCIYSFSGKEKLENSNPVC